MASEGNTQGNLELPAYWSRKPKDAPAKLVRMIDNEAQAIAVAIKAGGFKLAYVAAALGKSEGYVSRLRSGQRPIPEKLVKPFCRVVGNRLLEQYRELQSALELDARREIARMAALLQDAA